MEFMNLGSQAMSLEIGDIGVKQDRNGRFCLNDLHRASGGEKRHGPSYWLANSQTQALIQELRTTDIPVVASYEGAFGGTYVAKELVYAYAMWISPSFHLKVIRAYDQKKSQPVELSRMDILKLAMESEQARIEAEEKLAIAAPKVEFFDRVVERGTLMSATQVAQKIGMSALAMNKMLDELDVYSKNVKRARVFKQWFIEKGFGELKQTEQGFSQPLFTTAGEAWVVERLTSEGVV